MREQDIKNTGVNPFSPLYITKYRMSTIRKHYPEACKKLGYKPVRPMSMCEIMDMDRIVLDRYPDKVVTDMAERLARDGVQMPEAWLPFISEGVVIFPSNIPEEEVATYCCFGANTESIYVEVYAVGDIYTGGKPELSYRGTINCYGNNYEMNYESREKVVLDAHEKGKIHLTEFEVDTAIKAVEQLHGQFEYITKCITCLFRCINALLAQDEKHEGTSWPRPYSRVVRGDKRTGTRTKVVYLDSIAVEPGKNSKVRIRKGTIMNRHTDVWGVRGHERHYKSGKVIWIEPYEKGPERGKKRREPKEYRVR